MILNSNTVHELAIFINTEISYAVTNGASIKHRDGFIRLFAIPKSGYAAASLLLSIVPGVYKIVFDPTEADFFIDDIIDSGYTKQYYESTYNKKVLALVDKSNAVQMEFIRQSSAESDNEWIVFPFDKPSERDDKQVINRFLQYFGVAQNDLTHEHVNRFIDLIQRDPFNQLKDLNPRNNFQF